MAYRLSKSAVIIAIPVLLAIVGLGVYGLLHGQLFLGCLIPFGVALLIVTVIYGLLDNAPRVRLDSEGISAREWGWIKIRWEDIRDVKVISQPHTGTMITLAVKDADKYTAKLTDIDRLGRQVSRCFSGEPFSFDSTALATSNSQIVADIHRYIEAAKNVTGIDDAGCTR